MSNTNIDIIKRFQYYIETYSPLEMEVFPPLSETEMQDQERQFGFIFPGLLHDIYIIIGRVCTLYYWQFLGFTVQSQFEDVHICDYTILELYQEMKDEEIVPTKQDPIAGWPDQLIPFCTWGEHQYYCVDCSQEPFAVYRYNPHAYEYSRVTLHSSSLANWMEALLNGEDLWLSDRV